MFVLCKYWYWYIRWFYEIGFENLVVACIMMSEIGCWLWCWLLGSICEVDIAFRPNLYWCCGEIEIGMIWVFVITKELLKLD